MEDSQAPAASHTPVICEKCRATGWAGDEAFADIPDLLAFDPVPRRAHANNWTPEHQRAFIAALAITGNPRESARQVGRAMFGADQLRTAKGGRSFAAAWDAALEIARDREVARLHENLDELAARTADANAQAKASGRLVPPDNGDDGEGSAFEQEVEEARARILDRLRRLRKQQLLKVKDDPKKREAWDLVNGAENWQALEDGTWDDLCDDEAEQPIPNTTGNAAATDGTGSDGQGGRSAAALSRDRPVPRVRQL